MIHVLGVDGVGKSTLLNEVEKKGFSVLRCPQFHLSTNAKNILSTKEYQISQYFESMSQWADQFGRNDIKAWSLFYGMTLYSEIEKEHNGRFVFAERYPFFDTRIYAPIYLGLLKNIENEKIAETPFKMNSTVQEYLQKVCGQSDLLKSFSFIQDEISNPKSNTWMKVFKHFEKSKFIFLKAELGTILNRLALKNQGKSSEFHEKAQFLIQIQNGFQIFLDTVSDSDKKIIEVEKLSSSELNQILFQQYEKWQ